MRRLGKREQVIISDNMRPILGHRYWYTAQPRPAKASSLPEALPSIFPTSAVDEELDSPESQKAQNETSKTVSRKSTNSKTDSFGSQKPKETKNKKQNFKETALPNFDF